jgi:hypothetical protein
LSPEQSAYASCRVFLIAAFSRLNSEPVDGLDRGALRQRAGLFRNVYVAGRIPENRCKWPSERAATENIVKFTAVGFAHGLRKTFAPAGTCGTINNPDAGGMLFTYGGAPRKMYAGIAALTALFGVPEECVKAVTRDDLKAYVFRGKDRAVAIAWCGTEQKRPAPLAAEVRACDIKGNEIPASAAALSDSPVYLMSVSADAILQSLGL